MKKFFILLFAVVAAVMVAAQNLNTLPGPAPTPAPDRTIATKLAGIRLLPDSTQVAAPAAPGVDVSAVPGLANSSLAADLGRRIGQPLRFSDLRDIMAEIRGFYERAGKRFVNVLVPPQDLTAGVLTFVVIEARLGAVKVEGAQRVGADDYLRNFDLHPGQVVDTARLDRDLAWLGRAGYRQVSAEAQPGTAAGTTDLTLRVREARRWKFFTGYADTGTVSTDDERLFAGASWGDVGGRDCELSYQLTTSPDLRTSVTNSGSYALPIDRWRHILRASAAWSTIRADVPDPFDSKGYAWQLMLDYEIPLRDWDLGHVGKVKQSFTLGADVKQTNNNIEFSATPVTDTTTRIIQLRANWNGRLEDRLGSTSLSVTGVFSPGGMGAHNDDASFAASRGGAGANYAYGNLDLQRTTALPQGFSHVLGVTAQLSTGNLIGSEQLGFGGARSVRGYDEGVVFGDQGIILRNEIYAPSFGLLGRLGRIKLRDSVGLLAFWDYGVAKSRKLLPNEDPSVILASVGVGVRYQLASRLSAQFDYGWQQKDLGFPTRETHGRGHVSVTMNW